MLSDHKGTFIYLKSGAIKNQSYEQKVWAYQNADTCIDKLNSLINDTNWNTLINNTIDIDQAEENFTSTLLKHVKQCIPEKKNNNHYTKG
jgi:predicted lipase